MVRAENELGFLPSEAQPTGARLDHPEEAIHLELDAEGLFMSQNLKSSTLEGFTATCEKTANLSSELLRPATIFYSGLSVKLHWMFHSEDAALEASLKVGGAFPEDLANSLGMNPLHQSRTFAFQSGSYELHIRVKPVCFSQPASSSQKSHGFRQTKSQKAKIDRQNASEKLKVSPLGYALILDVDLQERNPPEGALRLQAATLNKYLEKITSDDRFSL